MGGNTKGSRRRFGAVRQFRSGRWQARYLGPDGIMHPADRTFATKTEAERWLTRIEAEIIEGDWIDPDAGRVPSVSTRLTGSRSGRAYGPRRPSSIVSCSAATSHRRSAVSPSLTSGKRRSADGGRAFSTQA